MTISTTQNQMAYVGDGVSTAFVFPFPFVATTDLKVFIDGTEAFAGFTVAGVAPTGGSGTFANGTITFNAPLPSLSELLIYCDPDLLQSMALPPNDPFPSKSVEKALDKLTLIIQRMFSKFGRSIVAPDGETGPLLTLPSAAERAGNLLGFDAFGNVMIIVAAAQSATALAISLATQIGASLIGFIQAGVGAVLRTLQAKGRETVSVDDFGAVGDNVTDDSAAIIAAQTALALRGGGQLLFTFGKSYRLVASSIPQAPGIRYRGTGRSSVDNAPNQRGARIVSAAKDLFTNAATLTAGIGFENLWIESEAGGGHVFNWSSAGIVAKVEFNGVTLVQGNAGKAVVQGTSVGGIFSIWMHDFEFRYMVGNTVPAINIVSPTVNSIVIERYWALCTLGATSGTYAIWVESTNAGGAAFNVNVKQGVHEVPGGGAVQLLSCQQSCIEDVGIYDLLVTPNNPMFRLAKGATGPASSDCSVRRLRSTIGTALKPDLQIDLSVAGQSGFIVENCALLWYDGVTASGNGVVHINNGISNFENAAFTEMGGSTGNDLRWISQSASGKSYAMFNGVPGNGEGYLQISQNGAYVGAISPTGLFEWGGTRAAPKFYADQTGNLNLAGHMYPGNPAGVDQAACGLLAGTGVPSNANGNNGDVYFNGAGGGGTTIYQKRAGAWVGIL